MIERIEETEEWMGQWRNKGAGGRGGSLLGRAVTGVKKKC